MAKYMITRIEDNPIPQDIEVKVERYRYNGNNSVWDLIFTYKVLKEKVDEVLKKYSKEEPNMNFYMYKCYNEDDTVRDIIYTSHIYLFE